MVLEVTNGITDLHHNSLLGPSFCTMHHVLNSSCDYRSNLIRHNKTIFHFAIEAVICKVEHLEQCVLFQVNLLRMTNSEAIL